MWCLHSQTNFVVHILKLRKANPFEYVYEYDSNAIKCFDVSTIQRINILIYDSVETLSPDSTIFIYEKKNASQERE